MTDISFENCSQDPETCSTTQQLFELDEFYAIASTMDERHVQTRRIICGLFNACANGTCPGREPELLQEFNQHVTDAVRDRE